MHKNFLLVTISVVFLSLFLSLSANAQEIKVLKELNLRALARGAQIKFIRIMDNGELWFFTTAIRGKNIRLIRKNLFTRAVRSFYLPVKNMDFLAVSADNKYAVLYNKQGREWWSVDAEKEKTDLLLSQKSSGRLLGLYGAKRSFIRYTDSGLYGWGFEYSAKRYICDSLVKFNLPVSADTPAFSRLISRTKLAQIAKKHFSQVRGIGRVLVSKNYLTFAAFTKKQGMLIGVNLRNKTSFVIDTFRVLMRSVIGPRGKYLAYVKNTKTLFNALYLYSLNRKKSKKLLVDKIVDVNFSSKGDKLGVALIDIRKPRKRKSRPRIVFGKMVILDLKKHQRKNFSMLKRNFYPYWRFVQEDKYIIFFNAKNSSFYRLQLEKKSKNNKK